MNFTPVIVGQTKLTFFIFQFFPHKLINRMNANFYRLKLFMFCIIMIFLKLPVKFGSYKFKKKHVFVNNKRTVIARNFFLENIVILIFFRMIPIQFKYLNPIIEKRQK